MRFLAKAKLSQNRYKTPEGYLVCLNCILSRTGEQEYRRGDFDSAAENPYELCKVMRVEDEVFNTEAMASFENKPITLEHPSGMVNLDNFKELSKGFVRNIRRGKDSDKDFMIGDLVITDKDAIEAVESGEKKDLSCGYDADVIVVDGQFRQINIRGNHVAIVSEGRAGNTHIVDSAPEKDAKATLTVQCYIFDEDSIVVQHRVGPVWKGIAVPGGHVNVGETPEQACIREVKEETGLDVSNLELVGTHQYHCEKDGDCIAMLYKTSTFSGELTDSDEGKVEWMDLDAVSASDGCAEGFKDLLKIACRTNVDTIDLESNATHDSTHKYTFDIEVEEDDRVKSKSITKHGNDLDEALKQLPDDVRIIKASEDDEKIVSFARKYGSIGHGTGSKDELRKAYKTFAEHKCSWDVSKHNGKECPIHDVMPREGESRSDFIGRAMSELKEEYPDTDQRLAVAYSYWRKAGHKDSVCPHCGKSPCECKDVGPMDARFLIVDLVDKLYFVEPNRWVADKSKATRFTHSAAVAKQKALGGNVAVYNEATSRITDSNNVVKAAKYAKYASLISKLSK